MPFGQSALAGMGYLDRQLEAGRQSAWMRGAGWLFVRWRLAVLVLAAAVSLFLCDSARKNPVVRGLFAIFFAFRAKIS